MRLSYCSLGNYREYHRGGELEQAGILCSKHKGSIIPKIEVYQQIKVYKEVIVYQK